MKLEERREVEELRRLLYVAVTRARDALYLAGEVDKDAILRAPKRSLASLLPLSLKQAFTRAFLTDQAEVQWEAAGHKFAARVCSPPSPAAAPLPATADLRSVAPEAAPPAQVAADLRSMATADIPLDREPLYSEGPIVRSATVI